MPTSTGFYGRETEIAWLRGMFEQCAARNADGKFIGGPRMAFVIAESGIGKSRLVQELYLQLTSDAIWDPPTIDYWPDAFLEVGAQLRTVPDMKGHVPKGPPRFAWLGARWQTTEVRNVQERRSILPSLRSSVMVHAEILKSHGSAWDDATARIVKSVKRDGVGETVSAIADLSSVPFVGLLMKLAKGTKDLVQDRMAGPRNFEQVEAEELKSEVDEVLDCMRLLLHNKSAVPTVLWLDDAQWIDAETTKFVDKLWAEAQRQQWPLLIVVTHWEREWRELAHAPSDSNEQSQLRAFEGTHGVDCLHLTKAGSIELDLCLSQRLPGLTASQRTLLVEKAAGNFLTMIENIAELRSEPMWFANERFDGVLTTAAVDHISKFETDRERRVRQRFQAFTAEVKKVLGWSTQLGVRFLSEVVAEFVGENLKHPDPAALLEQCVDPLVVLGKPSALTREFRDKVFHQVASEYRGKFLQRDETRLSQILRTHLIEWINNSFDSDGNGIWPNEENGIAPPERSATALKDEERRDLLGIAMRELALPKVPDWSSPKDIAAVRAVYLAVITDRRDGLWDRVRQLCQVVQGVDFAALPASVISVDNQEWWSNEASTSGAFQAAERLARSVLAHRRGVAEELDTPESRRDVSISLNNVAGIEEAHGDLDAALAKYEESLEISRRLEKELNTPENFRAVSFSLGRVAGIELARGDLDGALAKYAESLDMCRCLAAYLDTPQSRSDVSGTLEGVARIKAARRDYGGALSLYEECLEIRKRVAEESDTPQSRREVSVSLEKVAGMEEACGDLDAALTKYEESLEIRRRLVEEHSTPQSRRDVSVSLIKVASIEQARGNFDAALSNYEESLEMSRRLAEELGTPESHRDMMVGLIKVAGIEHARGELDAARAKYKASLEIARHLAEKLATPQSHHDLRLSLDRLTGIEHARGDHDAVLAIYEESLEFARGVAEKFGTPESCLGLSEILDTAAAINETRGDFDAALAKYEESLEIRRALLSQSDDALSEWHENFGRALLKCCNLCIETGHFARALPFASERWDVVLTHTEDEAEPWAYVVRLSELLPLMRCEIELDMQPHAEASQKAAQAMVDALVAAFDDAAIDKKEQGLTSITLYRCAEALELCARVSRMRSAAKEADALMLRSTELRARADALRAEEDATSFESTFE